MAKVVWTQEAETRLRKIHDYIAADKPGAAFQVVQSIYARAQILAEFPAAGQVHQSATGEDVRVLLWGHYRIVYREISDDEVHVLGVFHGAMQWEQYLK